MDVHVFLLRSEAVRLHLRLIAYWRTCAAEDPPQAGLMFALRLQHVVRVVLRLDARAALLLGLAVGSAHAILVNLGYEIHVAAGAGRMRPYCAPEVRHPSPVNVEHPTPLPPANRFPQPANIRTP
jgi:hypothetical protein